jgi:hypothetical protein
MSKTVLEQALDHLLNKEEGKASALLHDYYVGIGRQVYEDIMADDINFEDEDLNAVTDAVSEVESDLTEEGDEEFAPEMGDEEATDDLGADMGAEEAMPVDADSADVADAMMDVESALAKLKAEFEEMVSGEDVEATDEFAASEEMPESIEESAELTKVSNPDNGDKADQKRSPVAGKNPVGARPAVNFAAGAAEGTVSGTRPASAPKAQDMGGTTKPAFSRVSNKG